ncbi:SHOCT domain-containing protein [Massilia rhizosphaerae]|uniref:SHOCT domain-containing protein n=1 Tax=Massilia rhizosphaerae TaxID=2784389 RepID=UPI0018DBFC33|nr:SHOCT domain-containing protein [Massilia rhizosphaerae]
MMGNMMGYGWWGMGVGSVLMLLFWAFVILGIVGVIRWFLSQNGPDRGTRGKTPLEIVQERFARGEIGKEEYEQMKRDLAP